MVLVVGMRLRLKLRRVKPPLHSRVRIAIFADQIPVVRRGGRDPLPCADIYVRTFS